MTYQEIEKAVLEKIIPELEHDGYEVLVEYPRSILPLNVGSYFPDAVAKKRDSYIAIEVKSRRIASVDRHLKNLEKSFKHTPNWDFRVYYADEMSLPKGPGVESPEVLKSRLEKSQELNRQGEHALALLLSWATFEGIARLLRRKNFLRPQSPGRIITVLTELGDITNDQANFLRSLVSKRNSFVHGAVSTIVSRDEVEQFNNLALALVLSHMSKKKPSRS